MAISYEKLFKVLENKNIKKIDLQKNIGLSSTTIAKLSKNEPLSLEVLEKICQYLNCQVGDIVEFKKENENKLLEQLLEEKDMKLKGGIYNLVQVKFAYNSNHIEGSKLSEEQTRYIYETHSIISTRKKHYL